MLKQTNPYIQVFKLSTGEEIIASVIDNTQEHFIVEKPLQMVMAQAGFQFMPFMLMADQDKSLKLKKSLVLGEGTPISAISDQYKSATSNLLLPKQSSIIV